jgi:hypothetical protein
VRKFLFIVSLWLGVVLAASAENFTLVDGAVITGEIFKPDDSGLSIKTTDDVFTNISWARISQDTLKQLAANPKIKFLAEPFIEVDAAKRPQAAEIKINAVTRMEIPAKPSLFGGLFTSSLGLFLLLLVYAANLLAAYEISIVKARSAAQVMGVSALLPVIGPVIFLVMPMQLPKQSAEEKAEEALASEVAAAHKTPEEIQIAEASWKPQAEKKPEAQIFTRGKFTFNKRFVETRFGDFTGTAAGALAQKYSMEVRTMKDHLAVIRIAQIGQNEIIFETAAGPVTVPLSDIQEVKLNPKIA